MVHCTYSTVSGLSSFLGLQYSLERSLKIQSASYYFLSSYRIDSRLALLGSPVTKLGWACLPVFYSDSLIIRPWGLIEANSNGQIVLSSKRTRGQSNG
jgi:hypothetical protein